VKRAWLVRRKLEHFDDEHPQWVLCAERRGAFFESSARKRERDLGLQQRLAEIDAEGDVRILVVNHRKGAKRIWTGVAGAEIHPA
jgi:hypothetical protein